MQLKKSQILYSLLNNFFALQKRSNRSTVFAPKNVGRITWFFNLATLKYVINYWLLSTLLHGIKNQSGWFLRCWYVQEPASATLLTGGIFQPFTVPPCHRASYIDSWSVLLFWNTLKTLHLHVFLCAPVTVAAVSLPGIKTSTADFFLLLPITQSIFKCII